MNERPFAFKIKPFLDEILLYSGQFGLFYIIMQLVIEGAEFFLNFGHVWLLVFLILQSIILSIYGKSGIARVLFSFLVPIVYSSVELLEGSEYFFNAAHIGFWVYASISSFFMVIKEKETIISSRVAETILVVVNVCIFIFLYFYFDTWKEIQDRELLTLQKIFLFTPKFFSDPTHWFIIFGGMLLASTVAIGRYEISKLKDRIYSLFGKYVDQNVRDKIIQTGYMTSRREKLCVLFSDIRGFTKLCESNDPGSVTDMLNIYFETWNKIIKKHRGIIDKYIGDAIMVIFGLEDKQQACSLAVRCSLEFHEKFNEIADGLQKGELPVPEGYGIGCHFGGVIIGDIGSDDRKNYTVIGDTVNVASRLESETKTVNNKILISSDVYFELDAQLQDRFVKIGTLGLKGKEETIESWGIKKQEEPIHALDP